MSAGDFDNALGNYQKLLVSVREPRQQSDIESHMAQAYRYKGDVQHSIEAMEKSRQGVPENALTLTNLAILYEEVGRKDLARKYYEDAIRIDPNNALALNNLAYLISETNGDLNLALTYASRARQRLPNYTEIADTLGWIYLKKNLTDNAIDTYKGLVVHAAEIDVPLPLRDGALSEGRPRDGEERIPRRAGGPPEQNRGKPDPAVADRIG